MNFGELGEGYALVLRTADSVTEMRDLTLKNLDRLREWEPWAQTEQTLEGTAAYTQFQLELFATGSAVPGMILRGDTAVGSVSLKIDAYLHTAELGYWIDEEAEGRGVVTRACARMIEHAESVAVRRIEIRTAVGNTRSAAVAERLGFEREGVLRQALPIGADRLDVVIYGRVL
ncbi:GNAT family N-acetyltransferase [Cryobacterium zongtaii]|uniref:GNAT family N-acetyltransferase n=2 Tax=Microbacteriaceae TaxID=85023 RepID=A0A2S3Z7B4_9MICO|nr:GNAT family N-acetyltransferase [Cryobacterium zongtaii]